MKQIIFFILLCIANSCKEISVAHTDYNFLIKGTWILVSPDLPRTLYIKQNEVVVGTPFDTLFAYGYRLKNNTFLLIDQKGIKTENKILKLTKDSLVFKSITKAKKVMSQKYEPLIQNDLLQIFIRDTSILLENIPK